MNIYSSSRNLTKLKISGIVNYVIQLLYHKKEFEAILHFLQQPRWTTNYWRPFRVWTLHDHICYDQVSIFFKSSNL